MIPLVKNPGGLTLHQQQNSIFFLGYLHRMENSNNLTTIREVLDKILESSEDCDEVSIGDLLEMVGRRSFGPILLLAGIITLAPLVGDIPGVPTIMGTIVFLVAIQLLFNQKKLWLPNVLLKRSVKKEKLHKAINKLEKPAGYIDRLLRPRLTFLTSDAMIYVVAGICLLISLAMPVMEFIPFSANFAGAALTAFGLSLIAKDGLLALMGHIFTVSIIVFIVYNVM